MKTILITGGAGGFGKRVSESIAALGNKVIVADVNEATFTNENIVFKKLDLSSLESTRRFANDLKEEGVILDGILCNAGITSISGRSKDDNMDLCFEINYLAHFLLTLELLPSLTSTGRIMIMSSDMHVPLFGSIDWMDTKDVAYPEGDLAKSAIRYSYAKLCDLFFVYKFSKKLKVAGSQKVINAFNPGLMTSTNLMKNKEMFTEEFIENVKKMNRLGDIDVNTEVMTRLMVDDTLNIGSGNYYDRDVTATKSSNLSYNIDYQNQLWKDSLELVGLDEETVNNLI